MRRYVSKDKKRFWEVDASETGLTIRNGEVGKTGRRSFKEMPKAEATALAEKRIADKLKLGFTLVASDEAVEARNPSLEETIAASPGDPAGYHIYADWLLEQGEPRGQLIALDVEPASEAAEKKIRRARRAFLKANPAYDLPPRFGELANRRKKKSASVGTTCDAQWRHGFVASVKVGVEPSSPHSLLDLITELFAHPSVRFLQELHVGALADGRALDYTPIAALIASRAPASLRVLSLAEFDEDTGELESSRIDNLGEMLAALPGLQRLHLRIGHASLGALEHSSLETLDATISAIDDKGLAAIGNASLPALERLAINGADRSVPSSLLEPLFKAPPAGLHTLEITRSRDTGPLVAALLASPLGRQLRHLSLSFGDMVSADAIRARAPEDLESLDVAGNYLPESDEESLAALVATLAFRDQRENLIGYATVTEQQVRGFAPDGKSVTAARKVTKPSSWPRLGREPNLLWGECAGSSRYQVFARIAGEITDAACTCPSRKYPCKHALALLLMAANGHRFPREAAPASLVENAEYSRYDSAWE